MKNLVQVDCSVKTTALRAVLLHRPDAHPIWHSYMVSLVHMRDEPGFPPAHRTFADETHEIMVVALSPNCGDFPQEWSKIVHLTPPNLVQRLRGYTDDRARKLFDAFVKALAAHELNPDTDYRRSQLAWFERWGRAAS